jgi:hypothetical protein
MSGFLESQRLPMSSSRIAGGEAGTPSPAEIFIYPIFIWALARSLQLSYREELRRPLMHALLRLLGLRGICPKPTFACA